MPAILLSLVLGLPTTALAYWTTTGSGQRTATTATFAAPASVTATSTTGSSSAAIAWTASPSGAPTGYRVERSANGGGSWTTACAQANYPTAGSCTDSGLANGTYQYRVVALKGSWTAPLAAANPITITRDTVAPTVTVARAPGQVTPTRTQPMSFTATFSETVTGLTAAGVQVSPGTGVQGTAVVGLTGSGTTWTITVGGLSSTAAALDGGTVTVSLLANAAQDWGGNGSLASTGSTNMVTLDTTGPAKPSLAPDLTTDTAPPGSPVTSSLFSDNLTNSQILSFSGSGIPSDALGGQGILYRAASPTGAGAEIRRSTITGSSYTMADENAPEGTHYYYVLFTDALGNPGAQSDRLPVVVDRTGPTASPIITGSFKPLIGLANVTVNGTYAPEQVAGGSLVVYLCSGHVGLGCTATNAASVVIANMTASNSTWISSHPSGLLQGLGQLTAVAVYYDNAGNAGPITAMRQF